MTGTSNSCRSKRSVLSVFTERGGGDGVTGRGVKTPNSHRRNFNSHVPGFLALPLISRGIHFPFLRFRHVPRFESIELLITICTAVKWSSAFGPRGNLIDSQFRKSRMLDFSIKNSSRAESVEIPGIQATVARNNEESDYLLLENIVLLFIPRRIYYPTVIRQGCGGSNNPELTYFSLLFRQE